MKTKQSVYDFENISNKHQYMFVQNIYELNNETKILSYVVDKIEDQLIKRKEIIKYVDSSIEGWDTTNEYLPKGFTDDSNNDSKLRGAEGRFISKETTNKALPAKCRPKDSHHLIQARFKDYQWCLSHGRYNKVFLSMKWAYEFSRALFISVHNINQSHPIRYLNPLNKCYICGVTRTSEAAVI
uniref:Uncharacterized protein n=1 Tax=Clytia hemisphaerica TaxID=252671 RepID=A0A7M5X7R1_9CNID